MKKIVLVVLMVIMVSSPCLADETLPEWMNALHGTLWQSTCYSKVYTCNFAIYDGEIYGLESWGYCWTKGFQYYENLPIVIYNPQLNNPKIKNITIFLPMIGFGIEIWTSASWLPYINIALLHKVADGWEPAGCEDPGNF